MPHPGALEARVARTVRQHALFSPGARVGIAISGGADSVALTWIFHALAARGRLGAAIAGLVHVNHGLRGEESDRDEAFCRETAARLGWPIEVGHFDVAGAARKRRRSIEATARDIRYEFFGEAAARLGATHIATAHTIDDQAETVLLRLLRGTGGRGVTGIRMTRGPFVRPLLECRRDAVRDYLATRDLAFGEDSSNLDDSIPRNRIRHELLPLIARIAPGGVRALARFAALAGDDEDFLTRAAIEAAPIVVLSSEGRVELEVAALNTMPVSLARRLIRTTAERVAPRVGLAARHLDAVWRLASDDKTTGHLDLPGLSVERAGGVITVSTASRKRAGTDTGASVTFARDLPATGGVEVPEAGVRIDASLEQWSPGAAAENGRGDVAVIPVAALTLPLTVRNRRAGDRLRPVGAPGRRKLQDVLVDRKIPRHERDRVPLIVDAAGRLVWVVGVAIADQCRVTEAGGSMVVLKVHRLEKGEE